MKRNLDGNGTPPPPAPPAQGAEKSFDQDVDKLIGKSGTFQALIKATTEDARFQVLFETAARSVVRHDFVIEKIYSSTDWEDAQAKKVLVEALSRHARQLQNIVRLMGDRAEHRRRELEETKEEVVRRVVEAMASNMMAAMAEAEIPPDVRKKAMNLLQEKVKFIDV